MTSYSKAWYLIGCCLWIVGCQSISADRRHPSILCSPPPSMPPLALVEVGGEVMSPKTISVSKEHRLSLRQALLQAGGINEAHSTGIVPRIANTLPPQTGAVSSPSATVQRQDVDLQNKIVSILSDEKEMRQLLSVTSTMPGVAERIQFQLPDRESSDFDKFVKDVVGRVRLSLEFESPRKLDTSILDSTSDDPRVLVESLRSVFVTLRDLNPEYASNAVAVFDQFLRNSNPSTVLTGTPMEANQPTTERLPVPQVSDVNLADRMPLLIGLENQREAVSIKRTIFVHPELVFHTAIGDLPLRDGDFVYAIRADQTSLPTLLAIEHQSGNSVLGLDPKYNSIDPREYKTIDRLLNVKSKAMREAQEPISLEDVCLVTRFQQETLGEQVFCIPIEQVGRSTPKVPVGSIMPGDQFQFAYASRTPFLLERLVEPIQERVQQRVTEAQRRQEIRERLPTDGRYLSRWNASLQSYARPVVQSARNLVR